MPDEHVTTTAALRKSGPHRRWAARRIAAAAAVRLQACAHHSRNTCAFPEDFPQRPARLEEASGLAWAELARRQRGDPHTPRRFMALPEFAGGLGLGQPLTADDGRQDTGSER